MDVDIASIVISVVALAITLYFNMKQLKELTKKPKLEVKFDYSVIDISEQFAYSYTMSASKKSTVEVEKEVAEIARVKVFNSGEATAEKCIAKAEIFRDNKWETFGGVRLHWIRYWERLYEYTVGGFFKRVNIKELYKPVAIAVNDYEIADLVYVVKENLENYVAIRCDRGYDLSFKDIRIRLKKDDTIKVTVYCDNATSKSVCLRVKEVPTYDRINSGDVKNFFEEVECPNPSKYKPEEIQPMEDQASAYRGRA